MRNINQHNGAESHTDGHGRKIGKPKQTAGGFSEEAVMQGNRRDGEAPVLESPTGERWKPKSGKMQHRY